MYEYKVEPWDILQQLFKTEKINNHVLHFSGMYPAKLAFPRLRQAVTLLTNDFPLIRCNLRMLRGRPVWFDKEYTAQDIVSLVQSTDVETEQNRFLLQDIEPENGPQMKIALLKTVTADCLCVIMNHMLCDAAGFKEILYRLAFLYAAQKNDTEVPAVFMMKDRTVGQILKKLPLKKRLEIYLHKGPLSPRGKLEFSFEGDSNTPFIELRKIPREQFLQLKKYAKSSGASINDITMTVFLRVLSDMFGKTDTLPCTIDIRRFLPDRSTVGICNLATNIFCDADSKLPDTFTDTLEEVKRQMTKQKNDPACLKNLGLLENIFAVMPYRLALKLLKKFFHNPPITFTNIGILDKRKLAFGTTEMTEGFMTGSIKYPNSFQLSLSTFDDEAVFCVNLFGTQKDRKIIKYFMDTFVKELKSICPLQ